METQDPLQIAILLPVANGAEYLFESLTSVLQQTYPHWECWIALNGEGLTGPAEAVATALTQDDPRIHILHQPPTVTSKVAALNEALTHIPSTFQWIALLDVDDIWLPTKLAKQVAALQGPAAGATVIGTTATYFGAHVGNPAIPTGWIDPRVLKSLNPLMNSSVLMRREVAYWEYPPTHPSSLEDYFLWLKITAEEKMLFNVADALLLHRVSPHSAFNSRHESPLPLIQWWEAETANRLREKADANPTYILTTTCSHPEFLRIQVAAFRRFVPTPWTFVVFNDAKDWPDLTNAGDPTVRQQIEATCKELGIACIPIENQHHRHIHSASHRHCDTLRVVMEWIRAQGHKARYWMIDSDMWPCSPILGDEFAARFLNAGTFVRQVRGSKVYAWPNLWFLEMCGDTATNIADLCWDLAPDCDTGGASAPWVARQGAALQWMPPHEASGTWWPTAAHPESVRRFVAGDPRNQVPGQAAWAELYDGWLFHLRAGSNWTGTSPQVQADLSALVTRCFA